MRDPNSFLLIVMFVYLYVVFRRLGKTLAEAYTKFEEDADEIKQSLHELDLKLGGLGVPIGGPESK